ncbi:sensor histidine kinase [Oscillatoria sp. FACHB-1406]|nr:sensor histidine kinase [Oscillatoria sp. FACHB-1406]
MTFLIRSHIYLLARRATEKKEWIIINIIDSGCGFQAANLAYLFERLYPGALSRSRTYSDERAQALFGRGGSGLGFSIAR